MGRFISISFGLLVVFLSLSGTGADCPQDWFVYKGYCYFVFNQRTNWYEAEKFCTEQAAAGHLVSFHDSKEVDFMLTLTFPILEYDFVWIGLSDYWKDCHWEWSDGAQLDYKAWDNDLHCFTAKTADNQWMRRDCNRKFSFVCKCPA